MITTTARQIIADALILLGVRGVGSTLTDDEEQDAYRQLQSIIDMMSVTPGTMTSVLRTTGTLTSSVASFTIGAGGDFNVPRPVFADILGAAYLIPGSSPVSESQLAVYDEQAWQALPTKALTSSLPNGIYYNPTTPLGTIIPWPIPNQSITLVLYLKTAVTQFTTLTTSTILPGGLFQALKYTLANQVAPEYGVSVAPQIRADAEEAMRAYERSNTPMRVMQSSWPTPGQYDLWSDQTLR